MTHMKRLLPGEILIKSKFEETARRVEIPLTLATPWSRTDGFLLRPTSTREGIIAAYFWVT
jgi:hypothetical protein